MDAVLNPAAPLPGITDSRPVAARRAVTLLFFMNGVLFATWVSRLPAIEAARGLSHAELGVALLMIAAGAVAAMPLAGALSGRLGTAAICRVSAIIYCAVLPLLAVVQSTALWGLVLVVFGFAHGALDVAMNAQAVAVEKRYPRPIMSSIHALFSTGGLVGAAAGGLIAWSGMSPVLHFSVIGGAMLLLAMATFPWLMPRDNPLISNVESGDAGAGRGAEDGASGKWRLPPRRLVALGIVALCIMMGEGAMADWTAVYLRRIVGTSEGFAATGYAAFSIAMAGGRFLGDALAARWGAVRLVRASAGLAVLGMVLALLAPWSGVVLLGFALVGAGFATVVPLVFSAAGRTPGFHPGAALAAVTTIGYLGFLLGPPVIGFAAEGIGLRAALGLIAGTSLIAGLLAGNVRRA